MLFKPDNKERPFSSPSCLSNVNLKLTEGIFNINVLQMLPELDYDFKANSLYILRVNNNHYKAILLI